jgi:drug/metabolite transporter (DMT)-like permease
MAIIERDADGATGTFRPSALPAIGCKLASAAMLATMFALVKNLENAYPVGEIIFVRSFFALIPVLWLIHRLGAWRSLRTCRPWAHLRRSIAGLCSLFFSFTAVGMLPLGTATALGYTAPLFIALLAGPLLGETVRSRRWGVTVLGFCGMLLIIRPGIASESAGVYVALAGAVATAVALISIAKMADTESDLAIVFYFALAGTVAGAVSLPFDAVIPRFADLPILVAIGVLGGIAQILLTKAYGMAPASIIAPFEYATLLFALLLGLIIWGERPGWVEAAGILIIVASSAALAMEERRWGVIKPAAR